MLGMKWLSSLGEVAMNFQKLTMRCKEEEITRTLMGDPTLSRTKCSWKATLKSLKVDGEGYLITPEKEEAEPVAGLLVSRATQQILEEFDDICQPPMGLPP